MSCLGLWWSRLSDEPQDDALRRPPLATSRSAAPPSPTEPADPPVAPFQASRACFSPRALAWHRGACGRFLERRGLPGIARLRRRGPSLELLALLRGDWRGGHLLVLLRLCRAPENAYKKRTATVLAHLLCAHHRAGINALSAWLVSVFGPPDSLSPSATSSLGRLADARDGGVNEALRHVSHPHRCSASCARWCQDGGVSCSR